MPRLCHETVFTKLDSLTYLNFLAEPGEIACEKIAGHLDFMGIWGEFDPEHIEERVPWTDLNWWKDFLLSLWAPEKVYFKLIVHTLIGLSCFLLGIFYRYNTIHNLRSEIDQNKNKNSQLIYEKKVQDDNKKIQELQTSTNTLESVTLKDSKKENQQLRKARDQILAELVQEKNSKKILEHDYEKLRSENKNLINTIQKIKPYSTFNKTTQSSLLKSVWSQISCRVHQVPIPVTNTTGYSEKQKQNKIEVLEFLANFQKLNEVMPEINEKVDELAKCTDMEDVEKKLVQTIAFMWIRFTPLFSRLDYDELLEKYADTELVRQLVEIQDKYFEGEPSSRG